MDKELRTIPVTFEKLDSVDITDTRFTRVKIKLMHLGLNLNNSIFTKDVVDAAIPTLYNTPILGYVEKDKNGDKDFSDHRSVLTIDKKKISVTYKGSSYGVIPESCNPRYEKEMCEDGIEREYLVVDGLVWTKIEDSDIFLRDGIKKQSMELDEDSIEGDFDKEKHFVFSKIVFYGACALGENTTPAMIGSSIDTNFTLNEIKTKLEQFNTYFSKQSQTSNDDDINNENTEGGSILTKEFIDNILAGFSVSLDNIDFEITDTTTEDELRTYLTEFTKKDSLSDELINSVLAEFELTKEEIGEFSMDISENDFRSLVSNYASEKKATEPKAELPTSTVFSTYNEKRELLRGALKRSEERDEDGRLLYALDYWIADFDDNFVYVEKEEYDGNKWTYSKGRFAYVIVNNVVALTSDFEKMIVKWVTIEENASIEKARVTFEAQNAEFERLKKFEKDTLDAQFESSVNAIFEKFDESLANMSDYMTLKANFSNMELDAIEEKCFALLGKKNANFSVANKNTPDVVHTGIDNTVDEPEDDGYGGILSRKYN
ncbi:hypothetical protein [Konateibacter massiliensis]|uniref:hypothetical protein n=1 Tax=Konateibacter massiliensis TaxID=2002841 RepID=UPI000C15A68A|nr:hypothetical protein [Konateibacter massiliensis]